MSWKQIPQSSSIGFLTTERWGREHGVGGGVEEAGVLGWGGTVGGGTVAVAVAVAIAVAVAVVSVVVAVAVAVVSVAVAVAVAVF